MKNITVNTKSYRLPLPTSRPTFITRCIFSSTILLLTLTLMVPLPICAEESLQFELKNEDKVSNQVARDSNRPYLFLANENLPPMTYMQDGKLIGIMVDIGEALKAQMNHPVRLDYMLWAEAQKLVLEGKADALLHINSTEDRKKRFDFSDALLESKFSIYINHANLDIHRLEGLKGLKVGVLDKGLVYNMLKKDPLINLVAFPEILSGFRSLKNGELDAIVMDQHVGSFLLAENNISGIRITGEPIERSYSRIAVRKGDQALLAEINGALATIKENGTYAEIIAKWGPKEVVFQTKETLEAKEKTLLELYALATMACAMVLMFVFWTRSLKRMVKERTSELVSINKDLETEISEREKVEDQLRENRDYLKNLTDSIGDVVFSIKMPERTIAWVNESFKIFGYDPEECLGKSTEFLYASREDFLAQGENTVRSIAEGEDLIHSEANFRRKNGEVFPAETLTTLFRVDNEVVRATGILRDISARKLAEEQLLAYQQRLKALATQLTIAEEAERKRIATDLHDDVCQSLALLRIQLSSVLKKISDPPVVAKLNDISGSIQQTLQNTRNLMSDLSSPSMNEIGLSAAVSELLEELVGERHGLKTEFIDETAELPRKQLDGNVRTIMYRNVRELLANIVKHAWAHKVTVRMQVEGDNVILTVQDDGIGFDPAKTPIKNGQNGGFGLFSITERMADMAGTFEIVSAPDQGCTAILKVPIAPAPLNL